MEYMRAPHVLRVLLLAGPPHAIKSDPWQGQVLTMLPLTKAHSHTIRHEYVDANYRPKRLLH